MIRSVVLIRLKQCVPQSQIDELRHQLEELQFAGRGAFLLGRDAGLREGNMDLAIVTDFESEQAYKEYDIDPRHSQIRRDLLAPIADHVERCQFVF
jgi:hypothetical protein